MNGTNEVPHVCPTQHYYQSVCDRLRHGVRVFCKIMNYFIEKVKICPCLWDMGHISYRDLGTKDLAWDNIARECGMASGKEAKIQWKKLRDSHREALRRRKTATGQAALNFKPWKYEILMEFLLPPNEQRVYSNYTSDPANETRPLEPCNDNNLLEISYQPSSPLSESSLPASAESERKQKKFGTKPEILGRKLRIPRQFERNELRRKVIDRDRRVPQDALSNLFTSFCQKTRELPKYLQLRVQREIFDSVTRAEEEAMSYDSMNTYFSPTASPTSSYGYNTNQGSPLRESTTVTQSSPTYNASDPLSETSTPRVKRETD